MVLEFQLSMRMESNSCPDESLSPIFGGAPRVYRISRPLKFLALLSMKSFTSGNPPNFQLQISRNAPAALDFDDSSISSLQHWRHSFARDSSRTYSSSLLHLEQTSVSVKPKERQSNFSTQWAEFENIPIAMRTK
eukprot:CAMPEP_0113679848 /NCGR_PEP_ID=MMETSP0038_2-20120614/10911_1 /TAXON_ID=2898 /ORGANISM="Cryptomonas paramecium" /LENGTH=134 /DNA_ID=CAMNT_0000598003 /DNA_START=239 /DNA_END=643 /DNA_ORIENTATION=- /assembly_acc=CAM_ASM_000170